MAALAAGAVFLVLGFSLIWAATLGREWNSTHDRAFQRVRHVGRRQQSINTVLFLVGGVGMLALAVLGFVYAMRG